MKIIRTAAYNKIATIDPNQFSITDIDKGFEECMRRVKSIFYSYKDPPIDIDPYTKEGYKKWFLQAYELGLKGEPFPVLLEGNDTERLIKQFAYNIGSQKDTGPGPLPRHNFTE